MKLKIYFGLLSAVLFLSGAELWADIAIPTVTKVYFEKDGKPYRHSVDYKVTCYGHRFRPGPPTSQPESTAAIQDVFSYSTTCPDYGCEVYENYYLNYRKIEYCDLEGKAGGKSFKIEKYAKSPVDFSTCSHSQGQGRLQRSCTLKVSLPK
ncbi:MAG: hypothetical protein U1F57_05380 [bacterium]